MGRNPVYTHVYNQLRYQILSGELPIGSLLPPERKLAVQLEVSRNTIVRAYSELKAEGLIAGIMGSGRYVEALPPTPTLARVDWRNQPAHLHPTPSHMEEILSITDKYPHTINFAHGDGGKETLVQSRLTTYVEAAAIRSSSYLSRRRQLLSISEKYGIPIVEDDAYRHLHLGEASPPSLKELDSYGNVIYLNTFSKMLFPGLRIGWIAGTSPIISYVTRLRELTISTSTLNQHALADYLRDEALRPHLEAVTRLYAQQAQLMESQLRPLRSLGLDYEKPAGGFYFWISLPKGMKARSFMERCMEAGVSITSGDMFLLREAEQPYSRLCFTHEGAKQIEQGMSIFTRILLEHKEDPR